MPLYHLGLHSLPKYLFTGIQNEKGLGPANALKTGHSADNLIRDRFNITLTGLLNIVNFLLFDSFFPSE